MKVDSYPPNPPDLSPSIPIYFRPRAELIREFVVASPNSLRRSQSNSQSEIEQYGVGNQNLQGNIQQITFGRKKKKNRRFAYTEAPLIAFTKVPTSFK